MKNSFRAGQRFISTTEPELGLGIILEVEQRSLRLLFPGIEEERRYGLSSHPLKRVFFAEGDLVTDVEGKEFKIEQVIEEEGLYFYAHGGELLCETDLADTVIHNRPEERLFNGLVDGPKFFQFRLSCIEWGRKISTSPLRGLVGGRMSLIPHQLYIAKTVSDRPHPRVLLADEVGLGKTIEAGLILHSLLVKKVVQRTLIIVPDSLVHQWFVEMLRKFQLSFAVIGQETYLEEGSNPFVEQELVIASLGLLKEHQKARDLLSLSNWDMLIVDEAHQLSWTPEVASIEYKIVSELSRRIKGLLLLTATPEQLGPQSHFSRLNLIDPDRFFDYKSYVDDCSQMREVAEFAKALIEGSKKDPPKFFEKDFENFVKKSLSKEEILQYLIDCHGTGRIFFRNTRETMIDEFDFFPKRILHPYPLSCQHSDKREEGDGIDYVQGCFSKKLEWLLFFLENEENANEKVLLICHSKKSIEKIEKYLKSRMANINIGLFHSGLTLLARDRQAAYFHDPQGARILLCTEIGSEGRNFEFVQDLVLFDLPKKPDLLEQRIGRLDRIGQKKDIHIHVPYISDSWEDVLFSWYHEGLDAFENGLSVGSSVYTHFKGNLKELMDKDVCSKDSEFEKLLEETRDFSKKLLKEVQEGRDVLVEKNSFHHDKAYEIVDGIKDQERDCAIQSFMELAFDQLGVDIEEIDQDSYFIRPGDNMFIPHFPELNREGKCITYSRKRALEREDLIFINWDHPMVSEVINLVMGENLGNVTIATRKEGKGKKSFIECFFLLEGVGRAELEVEKYFPKTLIRVLMDNEGVDFSAKWPRSVLDKKLIPASRDLIKKATRIPREKINDLLKKAKELALLQKDFHLQNYREIIYHRFDHEVERLTMLRRKNLNIPESEIEHFKTKKEELLKVLDGAELQLDCFRLIL